MRGERFSHGGGVERWAAATGLAPAHILDFSASINPLGPPPQVLEAVRESLARIVHYPEIDAVTLEGELASYHGLQPQQVLAGNGSTELIYLLPRALSPRRALLVAPCFSEYERALRLAGAAVDFFHLRAQDGFALQPSALLGGLAADTDLVWLASPGNPSGTLPEPGQIAELALSLPQGVTLVVDEAFIDFVPDRSCLPLLERHDNLLILRSLTKFYAIPGLRAGYLLGAEERIARLAGQRLPWSLSTPALAAARSCLQAQDFRRRTLEEIPALRAGLAAGLQSLGLHLFPSVANYLLARLPEQRAVAPVAARLRSRGILIRDCGNFEGLDGSFLRLAVRSEAENSRLLQALAAEAGGSR